MEGLVTLIEIVKWNHKNKLWLLLQAKKINKERSWLLTRDNTARNKRRYYIIAQHSTAQTCNAFWRREQNNLHTDFRKVRYVRDRYPWNPQGLWSGPPAAAAAALPWNLCSDVTTVPENPALEILLRWDKTTVTTNSLKNPVLCLSFINILFPNDDTTSKWWFISWCKDWFFKAAHYLRVSSSCIFIIIIIIIIVIITMAV